jgi:hypothetical protein
LSGAATDPRISELIRKLLSLAANNPNREEAALAYQKAQELMRKHGLRIDVVGDGPPAPPPPQQASPPPPRPQWTPPPPPSKPAAAPQPSQGLGEFVSATLGLLIPASILGVEAPGPAAVGVVLFLLGWFFYLRLMGKSFISVWRNHRLASLAVAIFLAGLCLGIFVGFPGSAPTQTRTEPSQPPIEKTEMETPRPVETTTPEACELAGRRIWAAQPSTSSQEKSWYNLGQRRTYLSYLDEQGRCYLQTTFTSDEAWFKRLDILYDGLSEKQIVWAAIERDGKRSGNLIEEDSGPPAPGDHSYEKAMAFIHQTRKSGSLRVIESSP